MPSLQGHVQSDAWQPTNDENASDWNRSVYLGGHERHSPRGQGAEGTGSSDFATTSALLETYGFVGSRNDNELDSMQSHYDDGTGHPLVQPQQLSRSSMLSSARPAGLTTSYSNQVASNLDSLKWGDTGVSGFCPDVANPFDSNQFTPSSTLDETRCTSLTSTDTNNPALQSVSEKGDREEKSTDLKRSHVADFWPSPSKAQKYGQQSNCHSASAPNEQSKGAIRKVLVTKAHDHIVGTLLEDGDDEEKFPSHPFSSLAFLPSTLPHFLSSFLPTTLIHNSVPFLAP